jgi:hypothetical protein
VKSDVGTVSIVPADRFSILLVPPGKIGEKCFLRNASRTGTLSLENLPVHDVDGG